VSEGFRRLLEELTGQKITMKSVPVLIIPEFGEVEKRKTRNARRRVRKTYK
jgi:hypothetical protein